MDFKNNLTEDEIKKLKCAVCDNYLSHFPVYTSASGQNVCGRCPVPAEGYIKNEIYEILAQKTIFPCRYKGEGCYETLPARKIPQHEEQCPNRIIECVSRGFTECTEKLTYSDMIQHCEEKHFEYFLTDAEFEIDVSKSEKYDFLIRCESDIFAFRSEYESKQETFTFRLSSNVLYKAQFESKDTRLSVKCNNTGADGVNRISLTPLITSEKHKIVTTILLKPNFSSSMTKTDIRKKLSNLWKCGHCGEYVLPVDSMCNKGLCAKCLIADQRWSTSLLQKLAYLAPLAIFSCKNFKKGCTFSAPSSVIDTHHVFCHFSSCECPLNDYISCTWYGFGRELRSHLLADHHPVCLDSTVLSGSVAGFGSEPRCYLLTYFNCCFRLILVKREKKLYSIMQMLSEFQETFRYTVSIFNSNFVVPRVTTTQPCFPYTKKDDLEKNLERYHYVVLETLGKPDDDYFFKVSLSRNEH